MKPRVFMPWMFAFAFLVATLQLDGAHAHEPPSLAIDPKFFDAVKATEAKEQPNDSELRQLQRQRLAAAISEWEERQERMNAGRGTLDVALASGRRILDSRLALANTPPEKVAAYRQFVASAWQIEQLMRARFESGALKEQDFEQTKYARLDGEVELLRLGEKVAERKDERPKPIEKAAQEKPATAKDEAAPTDGRLFTFSKAPLFVIDPEEPQLKRWMKVRANCAMKEFRLRNDEFLAGRGLLDSWLDAGKRARDCRIELAPDHQQRRSVLKDCLDLQAAVKETEWYMRGCWTRQGWLSFQRPRLKAEIDLIRFDASVPPPKVEPSPLDDEIPDPSGFTTAKRFAVSDFDRLVKTSANYAIDETEMRWQEYRVGRGTLDTLHEVARCAKNARLELADKPEQVKEILTQYRDFVAEIEKLNKARYDARALLKCDLECSRYERLDADIALLQAKANAFGAVVLIMEEMVNHGEGTVVSLRLTNNSKQVIRHSGYGASVPRLIQQELVETQWRKLEWDWCGTGVQLFAVEPGKSIGIKSFFSKLPNTVRVGVICEESPLIKDGVVWSEPIKIEK